MDAFAWCKCWVGNSCHTTAKSMAIPLAVIKQVTTWNYLFPGNLCSGSGNHNTDQLPNLKFLIVWDFRRRRRRRRRRGAVGVGRHRRGGGRLAVGRRRAVSHRDVTRVTWRPAGWAGRSGGGRLACGFGADGVGGARANELPLCQLLLRHHSATASQRFSQAAPISSQFLSCHRWDCQHNRCIADEGIAGAHLLRSHVEPSISKPRFLS